MSHVTLAQGVVRIVSSMFHVVVRLDLSSTLHFHSLSHLPFHSPDLPLHLPCGSVRREVPCALPRMRSWALWPTTPLSQLQEQTTIESAKESPSYLDTKVLEREVMLSRVSKLGVVAVTSRFAASWNARAQWSCCGFLCGLALTASASDDVIASGY